MKQYSLYDTIEGEEFGPFPSEYEAYSFGLDFDLECGQLDQAGYDECRELLVQGFYEELNSVWWDVREVGDTRPLVHPC